MQDQDVDTAILKTLSYAAVFKASISFFRCFQLLHSEKPISYRSFERRVRFLVKNEVIYQKKEWLALDLSFIENAQGREYFSRIKKDKIVHLLKVICWIPWIIGVGVTGSVACQNALVPDDIDLILLTKTNRLWITRPIVLGILWVLGVLRTQATRSLQDKWCLNLWLDESGFAFTKPSLYVARELAQIDWIYSKEKVEEKLYGQNSWLYTYLANFKLAHRKKEKDLISIPNIFPQISRIITAANFIAYRFQMEYMRLKRTREVLTLHAAFFHPRATSFEIIAGYKHIFSRVKKRYNT